MRKSQAIRNFWSSFGLQAIDAYTVPTGDDKPEFPYITYTVSESAIDEPVLLNASIWYRSESWSDIEIKTKEIAELLENEHITATNYHAGLSNQDKDKKQKSW